MFKKLTSETSERLWAHQRDAIAFAIERLNAGDSPCLIRMPTGTGKTGVIACLTRIACQGTALVVTPWAHLRDQMIVDLRDRFCKARGIVVSERAVVGMMPSTVSELLDAEGAKVLVATFSTLNQIRRNSPKQYARLSEELSLVIADEGHYEPAIEWGKSVRNLKVPVVLLTATPYRNDLKLFRIKDPTKSTFHFTHEQAESKAIVRKVAFKEIDPGAHLTALAGAFASAWKRAQKAGRLPSKSPRAIVCCESDENIAVVVNTLRALGLNAIGIHDRFEGRSERFLHKNVPSPHVEQAAIWVHQRKLTEGLDDHRFCCLALFTPMRNDRKLIQQIGRVLRIGKDEREQPALVFMPKGHSAEGQWGAYREFETKLELLAPDHFQKVVLGLLDRQPSVEYFDGRFRRRFDPMKSGTPAVIIPPSVLVRGVSSTFSLEEYIEDCTDTLNLTDAVILGTDLNGPMVKGRDHALWVYATVGNSQLLSDTSLYEIKLETHCVVVSGDKVFMSDSAGNLPQEYLSDRTVRLASETLGRYMDTRFRPTQVSVSSVLPYDTVVRSAELSGQNLMSVATSLTDRIHICRSIKGAALGEGRRYVGLVNGRVRKEVNAEDRRHFDLEAFRKWAHDVAAILRSSGPINPMLNRYLRTCDPPSSVVPRTLCIDLQSSSVELKTEDGDEVWLKNGTGDVVVRGARKEYQCTLELEYKGGSRDHSGILLSLAYDPGKRRFHFRQVKGPGVIVGADDGREVKDKSLPEFLDQNQDTLLIGLSGGEIVYQGSQFFRIDYSYAEKALVDLVKRLPKVAACTSEKGEKTQIESLKKSKGTSFPSGSLFNAIAGSKELVPFEPELLICDDLGTECADFVAVNFKNKQLALIHAKTGSGAKISASAFHDVVAQAMKNMVYFTRSPDEPTGLASWTKAARWNNTNVPKLIRSTRDTPESGKKIWKKVQEDILTRSSPDLYVVLATAGCCETDALRKAIAKVDERTPETAQLVHLLDGLSGHARQLGVKLVVYDVPFKQAKSRKKK